MVSYIDKVRKLLYIKQTLSICKISILNLPEIVDFTRECQLRFQLPRQFVILILTIFKVVMVDYVSIKCMNNSLLLIFQQARLVRKCMNL